MAIFFSPKIRYFHFKPGKFIPRLGRLKTLQESNCPTFGIQEFKVPFEFDSIARPIPNKHFLKSIKFIEFNELNDFYYYLIWNLGELTLAETNEILTKSMQFSSRLNTKLIEISLQNIILNQGFQAGLEFSDYVQNEFNLSQSLNWSVILYQGAMEEFDLENSREIFNTIKKSWWPIPQKSFTYLIGSILDAMIKIYRKSIDPIDIRDASKEYLKALKFIITCMERQGNRLDFEQYKVIICGLCQIELVQESFFVLHQMTEKKVSPDAIILNFLTIAISQYKYQSILCIPQFNQTLKANQIILYLLELYRSHKLKPDLKTVISLFKYSQDNKPFLLKLNQIFKEFNEADFIMQIKIKNHFLNAMNTNGGGKFDKQRAWDGYLGNGINGKQRITWGLLGI
jgi:pentatricopeptide repeat protein